jgi:protein-tyrosine phosphatase
MIRVLFVCSGNICRSPMAEAVFRHMVAQAGLSNRIQTLSAGTGPWHVGEAAHHGTLGVLKQRGIAHNGRARQLTVDHLQQFDYALAMDGGHLSFMKRLDDDGGRATLALFLSYANAAGTVSETDVPDPYYDGTFERVYSLVERGCSALLAHIRAEHGL